MTKLGREKYRYYLQPGRAGREEAFAEIFANLHGSGAQLSFRLSDWRTTFKVIEGFIAAET